MKKLQKELDRSVEAVCRESDRLVDVANAIDDSDVALRPEQEKALLNVIANLAYAMRGA